MDLQVRRRVAAAAATCSARPALRAPRALSPHWAAPLGEQAAQQGGWAASPASSGGGGGGGGRQAHAQLPWPRVCVLLSPACTIPCPPHRLCRMEEAYDAAVAQCGGLEAAKPKGVFEAMQATGEFPELTLQVGACSGT